MKRLHKILPILFMIWPYVLLCFNWVENESIQSVIFTFYRVLTVLVLIGNVINPFIYKGERNTYELALFNMLIKLSHIPFYLGVFVLGIAFFFASVVPALIFVTPILIISLVIIDIIMMVCSSMYGINAIWRGCKDGTIRLKSAIIHTVMHFCFVTDVISSIIIFVKVKKNNKNSL